VTIEHNPSKDGTKTYSNILSVKPYTGKKEVKMVGPLITWGFGEEGFDELPSNIKRKIEASIEKTEKDSAKSDQFQHNGEDIEDQDVPF
jgi:hypothetical protein